MSSKNNKKLTDEVMFATYQHIEEMASICAGQLVKNRKEEDAQSIKKSGFLIGELTKKQWQDIINDKENSLALILKRGEEVIGYLTGFDIIKTESEFQEKVLFLLKLKKSEKKIFYHSQIAKKPNSKNVGKPLTMAMIDEIKKRGYHSIVCKIVHQPIKNEASITFHEKLGFKCIGEIDQENYLRGIYLLEIWGRYTN